MPFSPLATNHANGVGEVINAATVNDLAQAVNELKAAINVRDYGATGNGSTNDTAAIQAAIDAVPSNGGVVYLPVGTYRTSAPLLIQKDNVSLVGAGMGTPKGNPPGGTSPVFGGSVIRPLASFTGSAVIRVAEAGTATRALSGVFLRDFAIDGYYLPAALTVGIYFQVFNGGIVLVNVSRVTGDGIKIEGNGATDWPDGAWDNFVTNVKVDDVGGNGMTFSSYSSDNVVVGCIIEYADGHGMYFDSTSPANMLTACYVYNCLGKAVQSNNMHQQKFVGCRFQDCNGGIYLTNSFGTGGFVIEGCTFRNMSFSTDNTTDAINLAPTITTRGGMISGCDFHTDVGNGNLGGAGTYNRARYGINVATGLMNGAFIGPNVFDYNGALSSVGTSAVNDTGASTIVMGPGQTSLGSVVEFKLGNSVRVVSRAGTPEGSVFAPPGSLCLRTDGGAGTTFYVKETGTGNTGWVGK
jgi:hypothetical protein